jgi:asparagine synthase (glutamine-hydrolysing)
MCAILGMFCSAGIDPDQVDFKRALSLLERRGPDDSGIWQDEHARLGHQRLAVVDLSREVA